MSDIQTWSVTAASNNAAAPDGWPEGMVISAVNNAARETHAAVRRLYGDWAGSLTSGGSSNAYTLSPNRTISAYAAGIGFLFAANHANTSTATLNVSSLGAKDLRDRDGAALVSGDIESGAILHAVYDNANGYFRVLNLLTGSGGAVSDLDSLSDVAISTATSGDLLRYNGSSWVNASLSASLAAASTTVAGIVELATAAESLTGSSQTLALTPGGLAGNASFAGAGYYKFPGGFVVQWGASAVGATTTDTITFPSAFPTSAAAISVTILENNTTDRSPLKAIRTSTQLTVYNPNAATMSYAWVAVGY